MKIHKLSVYRGGVELEITCMNNIADRCFYTESNSVHNAVCHSQKFNFKNPEVYNSPRLYSDKFNMFKVVFFEFMPDKSESKRRAVDRDVYFF